MGEQYFFAGRPVQRVNSWRDLPPGRRPAVFEIVSGSGEIWRITVSGRRRQALELLMQGPVVCTSSPRIAPHESDLRAMGVEIGVAPQRIYEGDRTGRLPVYNLRSQVAQL